MTVIQQKYRTGFARLIAAIIDGIILLPLSFLNYLLIDETLEYWLFILIFQTLVTIFYSVLLHYIYGQTVGKMIMHIKVLDSSEIKSLSLKQAILRDSVSILFQLLAISYVVFQMLTSTTIYFTVAYELLEWIPVLWLIIELISMLTNKRRRAVHDLIAKTVVVNQR